MKLNRPSPIDVAKRRRVVESIIRENDVSTIEQIHKILQEQHGYRVATETVRRDLSHIGVAKDSHRDVYILIDNQVSRFDLYEMLKHACSNLLIDIKINAAKDTIFLYPEIGTSKRFVYFLEAIRQEEQLTQQRRASVDNILATVASDDVVVIHMQDSTAGTKFYKKLQFLSSYTQDLDFADTPEELNFIKQFVAEK